MDPLDSQLNLADALKQIETIIGASASTVIGAPEYNLSKLKDLLICLNKTQLGPFNATDHKNTVLGLHRLIAKAATRVFQDIIPSYRIKQSQEDDKVKLSKDVAKLRQYERTFSNLYKSYYLDYLKRMLDCVKNKPASTFYTQLIKTDTHDRELLAETAVECYGMILVAHPHFNYRDQIISNLVQYNAQTKHKTCAQTAHKYLSFALQQDKLGEISLEITSAICDLTKVKKLSVSALLFKTLSSLKLIDVKTATEEDKAKRKAEKEKLAELKKKQSRKERKRGKKMKKLKNELHETEAHVGKDQKLKFHQQILKKLFVTYFRVLRYHEDLLGEKRETQKLVKLLPPVLEGVAKFSHLIDIDICNGIFPLISHLLENNNVTTNCKLHCLATVFIMYKSLESELGKVDPENFYRHFYVILTNLDPSAITDEEFSSLNDCIHLMLIKRSRQVSSKRYCAFVRRLLILSLNLPPKHVANLLDTVKILFLQKPNIKAIFDSTNCSDFGSGQFDIAVEDPDFSNADSSVAWELHILRSHIEMEHTACGLFEHANFARTQPLPKRGRQV